MRPMRVYGPNLIELFLCDFASIAAGIIVAFALIAGVLVPATGEGGAAEALASGYLGGALVAGTAAAGITLWLAASGVRQNAAAMDPALALLVLAGCGWLLSLIGSFKAGSLVVGVLMLLLPAFLVFLRNQALRARFKPRFLSLRQFGTMVQIVDTMMESDGELAVHPVDAAVRLDHLLADVQEASAGRKGNSRRIRRAAEVEAPILGKIRQLLFFTEWLLPLTSFRPFPFTALGSTARRQAVERIRDSKRVALFRDIARMIKTGACVGYYGSPEGMRQVGYVPFEKRENRRGSDQRPIPFPDPFPDPSESNR